MSEPVDEVEAASLLFDQMTLERHQAGAEKYGPGKFLQVDTIEEALQELADLANYARYTFIKLVLLRDGLASREAPSVPPMGAAGVSNPYGG